MTNGTVETVNTEGTGATGSSGGGGEQNGGANSSGGGQGNAGGGNGGATNQNNGGGTTDIPTQQTTTQAKPEWKVPDAYKEKPWAQKVKSEEDVYKQLDNLDSLVGKKNVVPDFKTAKPEEIEAFYSQLRPADKAAYQFGENADKEFVSTFQDSFHKNGISETQSKSLIADYQKLETAKLEQMTSADGFKQVMTKTFGEKYDADVAAVVADQKKMFSTEEQSMLEKMPNQYLAAFYKQSREYQKQLDAVKKEYGATESGAQVNGGNGTMPAANVEETRKTLRAEIRALDGKPFSEKALQEKKDALQATYSTQQRK